MVAWIRENHPDSLPQVRSSAMGRERMRTDSAIGDIVVENAGEAE